MISVSVCPSPTSFDFPLWTQLPPTPKRVGPEMQEGGDRCAAPALHLNKRSSVFVDSVLS